MRTLRIPVAMAVSVVALLGASTGFAAEKYDTATPPAAANPAPAAANPAQAGPPQIIVIQPPAPQQQPQAPQVVEPVGKARTTQAEYTPPLRDQFAEKTVEKRPNGTMLSTGTGMFVLSYAPAAVIGAMSPRHEDKRLLLPVAGPWLDLKNRDCRGRSCGENEGLAKAALITSGVAQGAGALMMLGSLLIPEKSTVIEHTRAAAKAEKPSVKIVPVSFGDGGGIGAIGRF